MVDHCISTTMVASPSHACVEKKYWWLTNKKVIIYCCDFPLFQHDITNYVNVSDWFHISRSLISMWKTQEHWFRLSNKRILKRRLIFLMQRLLYRQGLNWLSSWKPDLFSILEDTRKSLICFRITSLAWKCLRTIHQHPLLLRLRFHPTTTPNHYRENESSYCPPMVARRTIL